MTRQTSRDREPLRSHVARLHGAGSTLPARGRERMGGPVIIPRLARRSAVSVSGCGAAVHRSRRAKEQLGWLSRGSKAF
jgi:hypothetical protein